ncbi:MAG: ComEC/Rec2 family competence protein [Desulfovibrio sp.]|jgi:competence protein ComEC|nr:ComEC/Rec2 family competence protein [Desulfovibrio sp.]
MRQPPLQAPLIWQYYLAFWILGILGAVWLNQALFCALLPPFVDSRLRRPRRLALASFIFLCGCLISGWRLAAVSLPTGLPADTGGSRKSGLCGVVQDVQSLPDNRLRVLLEKARFQDNPQNTETGPVPGLVAWTWENPSFTPLAGQSVCLDRRPRPARGFVNEGMEDFGVWWRGHGVALLVWSREEQGNPRFSGQGTLAARWRESLREKFVTGLAPDVAQAQGLSGMPQGSALLPALLFGDRRYIRQQTINNFSAAALAHSLALSGLHLALAGLVGTMCVLAAARAYAPLYLRKPRLTWAALAACPLALVYLWLGNAPPSLIRAGCMLCILAFWLARQKARTLPDVLCAAVLCITTAAPLSALDTGMRLSVLCVGAIGLALPLLRGILPRREWGDGESRFRRLCRGLLQILLLSLSIQVMLLPLNLLLFGNAGLWFPLNALWLPLLEFLVLPSAALGLVLQAVGLDWAAHFVLELAAAPCQEFADMLAWLNRHGLFDIPAFLRPHWTSLPAFAALGCAAALAAGRKTPLRAGRRLLALGCVLLCAGPFLRIQARASGTIGLSMLDVGQGQSVVLELPGDMRLLLDGGGGSSPRLDIGKAVVAPVLSYNAAPRLTAVLNSHPDTDHLGGLLHVLGAFEVNEIFDNGQRAAGAMEREWEAFASRRHSLRAGDSLLLEQAGPGLRLEVLWPPQAPAGDEKDKEPHGNDASLVLRLSRFGQGLALVPGDCGPAALKKLLVSGRDVRAKVLVAPHHGSDKSFWPDFYRAVGPEVVLASCGFQNSHGHPGPKLRNWLARRDIPLLTTAENGQIRLTFPRDGAVRAAGKYAASRGHSVLDLRVLTIE